MWASLEPTEALILRRLSVFAGGWTLDAAQRVCADEDLDVAEITAAHEALVAKSLIAVDAEDPLRHWMPRATEREVRGKVVEADESEWLSLRHAQWCLGLVNDGSAEPVSVVDEAWLRRVDREMENIRAALAWARDGGDVQVGIALVSAVVRRWGARGLLNEALHWVSWAMAQQTEATPLSLQAILTLRASVVHCRLGHAQAGMALAEQAATLFRASGDPWGAAFARHFTSFDGRPSNALPAFDDSLRVARAEGEVNHLAHLLRTRGQALFFSGQLGAARSDFDECVQLGRHPAGDGVLVQGLLGLARVDLAVGNLAAAARELHDGLALAGRAGHHPSQSIALGMTGELCRLRGDYGRSRALLRKAIEADRGAGESLALARSQLFLGRLEWATGACDTARALFQDALALGRSAKAPPYHEVRCLLGLAAATMGTTDRGTADMDAARHVAEQAAMVAAANDDRQAAGESLRLLARMGRATGGENAQGIQLCQEALRLYDAVGDLPGITTCLEDLGALFADRGWYESATRLLGAAAALREVGGHARPPVDHDAYDQV
ncbi:MAG: hypothetical protein M3010_01870, partial [Candidatus Dormibacteraeota bacterium]|nr:hypothetical protein [Candidatus Dormibacteraeota bacterium]